MSTSISVLPCLGSHPPPVSRALRLATRHRHARRNGWSLIEIMLVITVIAIGSMFVFSLVQGAMNSQKASAEASAYATMSTDTRTVYSSQGSYTGVSTANMIKLGLVPATMVKGNDIISSFNTKVTVAAINLNGTAADGIQFTYTLPREACPKFVQNVALSSAKVTVDGKVVLNRPGGKNTVDVTVLAGACNSGAGGNVPVLLAQGR